MSSMMTPSAYGGAAPGGACAPGYYGYGGASSFPPPYYHPQQHHPAADSLRNPFSSFFPGTTMSYPIPNTRGDYQQAPFSAPNVIGQQHPSTMMLGGLFPPTQYAYPNPSLSDSMLYRHGGASTASINSSFVQDTLCCGVGNESSLDATSCTTKSNQCE